jgi:hypothetical protein
MINNADFVCEVCVRAVSGHRPLSENSTGHLKKKRSPHKRGPYFMRFSLESLRGTLWSRLKAIELLIAVLWACKGIISGAFRADMEAINSAALCVRNRSISSDYGQWGAEPDWFPVLIKRALGAPSDRSRAQTSDQHDCRRLCVYPILTELSSFDGFGEYGTSVGVRRACPHWRSTC